jgi:transcriptional regulator with XRE-family HTH domain
MLVIKKLSKNIKKIRVKRNMTQGDVCRILDMDRGYMSAIENGKKNITLLQLEKIAKALRISSSELLK